MCKINNVHVEFKSMIDIPTLKFQIVLFHRLNEFGKMTHIFKIKWKKKPKTD